MRWMCAAEPLRIGDARPRGQFVGSDGRGSGRRGGEGAGLVGGSLLDGGAVLLNETFAAVTPAAPWIGTDGRTDPAAQGAFFGISPHEQC